ncbi:hypothetical protein E9232_006118 [Inquilinus ginsengisoli]|uniref:DUF5666 domain-containing protein n=1 Tax=Inquilinus ginsengisoli TaxID=363840 RepID=A0ABU1JY57_9PROT|nr:hypothetical protein [Inquilinus ginsengisoli]MDR6293567.1 hypothetical protein [Inquilinus ginsengisoli]
MIQSVSRVTTLALTVAAIGLGACTDTTPWAYPTEPSAVAQRSVTVESAPVAIAPAPRIIGAAPPAATYVEPQPVAPPPAARAVQAQAPITYSTPRVVTVAPAPVGVQPMAPVQRVVTAPATVVVPAGPVLVEKSGLIDVVLSDNKGRTDGVILKDDTVIRFSPDFAAAMDPDGSRLAPGRPIVVRGNWGGNRRKAQVLNAVEMGTDIYSLVTLAPYAY